MTREGQERVEVRPGVFLWLNEEDRKAYGERAAEPEAAPVAAPEAPETTAVEPPRTAARPRPRSRK